MHEPMLASLGVQTKSGPFFSVMPSYRASKFRNNWPLSLVTRSTQINCKGRYGLQTILRAKRLMSVLQQVVVAVEGPGFSVGIERCGRHSGFFPSLAHVLEVVAQGCRLGEGGCSLAV